MTTPSRHRARILVVGCGGLGAPSVLALAHGGIGTLGLCDDDVVDESNLHRQILFDEADVGAPKVVAAKRAIEARLHGERCPAFELHAHRVLPDNALELVSRYDVVIEGSDNFATKFLLSDACHIARVPIVHGAAVRWHGTAMAARGEGAPCYRCVFEDVPRGDAPNCAEAGVMGPVVGVVGAIMADLALAIVDGVELFGTLVRFDGKSGQARRHTLAAQPNCRLCGSDASPFDLTWERYENQSACAV